ncbi:hypothetical protein TcasGA2_TC009353 [Tribolium castaneum]|uniref:Uncharacterized protein n=1 Tax=Tribolium castaneum TaxID=7070 RepID=D6WRD8_TRICA|nr:hypothetical protein TcasGA2_TC009353 [Tribolium castaneum]
MPNIAYLVSGLFKDRMRSRRCAIVFTHRIVAKTRAAVASALFDTGDAGRLSFVSGQTSIAPYTSVVAGEVSYCTDFSVLLALR